MWVRIACHRLKKLGGGNAHGYSLVCCSGLLVAYSICIVPLFFIIRIPKFGSGKAPGLKSTSSDKASQLDVIRSFPKALWRELTAGRHALLLFLPLGWNVDMIDFTLATILWSRGDFQEENWMIWNQNDKEGNIKRAWFSGDRGATTVGLLCSHPHPSQMRVKHVSIFYITNTRAFFYTQLNSIIGWYYMYGIFLEA